MIGAAPAPKIRLHLPEIERVARWEEIRDLCRVAEDVGFDSLWMPDHLLYRDTEGVATGPWECWSLLSAVASVTKRVSIGPLVLCTSFRDPGPVAKMALTLDEISEGRLILGLGAVWNRGEYEAFGYPYASRYERFAEAFTIITTLLREGSIDFEGCYYTLRDCEMRPASPRPGGPPVIIGSKGPRVLRHALPHAAYWNGWSRWWGNNVERAGPLLEQVDEISREAGRAAGEIRKTAAVFVRLPGGTTQDNPDAPHLMGTSEELSAYLLQYAERGVEHLQVVLDPVTTAGIEQFALVLEQLRHA